MQDPKRSIKMKITDEKQEIIFPTKIVKTVGIVDNIDNLLRKKPLAILSTHNESDITMLKKQGDAPTYVLLDFGKELQGGIRVIVTKTEKTYTKLRIVFGESVSEALSNLGEKNSTNDHSPRDITVDISNLSALDFGRTGFRFCRIELAEEGRVWFKNIVAVSRTANIEQKGYIKTSDERYNKILDTALYTAYLNVQDGVIWDGIKRDRLVWAGDLNSEILAINYMYGNIPNVKNCLELLRNETPDDRWINNIPSYNAWWIINLIDYYKFTGDGEFFKNNIDFVNYILSNFDDCIGDDVDFLRTGKFTHNPFFLDWPTAQTENGVIGSVVLIAYAIQKLREHEYEGVDYAKADVIMNNIEKYLTLPVTAKETLAMQMCCGANPEGAKEFLEAGGASGYSTFMAYFIMKALEKSGSTRNIEIAKDYYGGMLDRGATSFWEDFQYEWLEGSGRIDEETPEGLKDIHADYGRFCYIGLRHSLCHGWSCGVLPYTVENILGLQILEPGYKKISVKPNLQGLEWIEGAVPTPYGIVKIRKKQGEAVEIDAPPEIEIL